MRGSGLHSTSAELLLCRSHTGSSKGDGPAASEKGLTPACPFMQRATADCKLAQKDSATLTGRRFGCTV